MMLTIQPRQQQRQALSPAMLLGLDLLSLPIGELRETVKKEVESNPALEPFESDVHRRRTTETAAAANYLENMADESGESLGEHLMSELRMSGVEGRELDLCRAVIAEIDGDGRFQGSMPDLCMVTGATAAELEAVRLKVMSIDPKGCGARSLGECYRAQIGGVQGAKRALAEKAIAAVEKMAAGSKGVEIPPEALKLLKTLNPFPGRLYDHRRVDYVCPDVKVDENGEVEVDQRDIPELRVSPKYMAMARDASLDEETRKFAAERVRRAREFREAVIKRQETMEKVAELAIGGQSGFLKGGAGALRRQTMSEVARKAKCNVATVSRAAARKYVKTPRGTVPLRKFFQLIDQAPVEKLREILGDGSGAITDARASELMSEAGFKMARRTVAKYRARILGKKTERKTEQWSNS